MTSFDKYLFVVSKICTEYDKCALNYYALLLFNQSSFTFEVNTGPNKHAQICNLCDIATGFMSYAKH